jgi:hypothetical protein
MGMDSISDVFVNVVALAAFLGFFNWILERDF